MSHSYDPAMYLGNLKEKKLYLDRTCMNIFLLHLFALTKKEEKLKYFQNANN